MNDGNPDENSEMWHPAEPASALVAPQNLEAEQAFLGAMLYDNDVYHRVAGWLKPGDFYDPVHARIFETAAVIIERGSLADAVVLKTRFEHDEGFKDIGGTHYLAVLIESAANNSAAVEYGRMIRGEAQRRALICLADRVTAEARDGAIDPKVTHESAENELAELAAGQHTGSTRVVRVGAAAREAIVEMENAKTGKFLTPTGLVDLDAKIGGIAPGEVVILAGRPGMGKTLLAGALCRNHALRAIAEDMRWPKADDFKMHHSGFVAIEMSASRITTRLIASHGDISYSKMRRGELSARDADIARSVADELDAWPMEIIDMPGATVPKIHGYLRRMKRGVERAGGQFDFCVIDYLQKLKAHTKRGGKVEEIGDISNAIKDMARDLAIGVYVPTQVGRGVEDPARKDPRPGLIDLKWSGEIEADADVIIGLYRDAYYAEKDLKSYKGRDPSEEHELLMRSQSKTLEAILLKSREGALGTVTLFCNPETGLIDNLDQTARMI
jgi:replicative DNA helicase